MRKIMIVDDQPEVRELVNITLSSEEYQILETDSGEKAIEIAKYEKPDLILMDLMMPGSIDGLEATKVIKSNPDTKDMYIIILTAKGQKKDIEIGMQAGADNYLTKPFSPLNLCMKVEEILNNSRRK